MLGFGCFRGIQGDIQVGCWICKSEQSHVTLTCVSLAFDYTCESHCHEEIEWRPGFWQDWVGLSISKTQARETWRISAFKQREKQVCKGIWEEENREIGIKIEINVLCLKT